MKLLKKAGSRVLGQREKCEKTVLRECTDLPQAAGESSPSLPSSEGSIPSSSGSNHNFQSSFRMVMPISSSFPCGASESPGVCQRSPDGSASDTPSMNRSTPPMSGSCTSPSVVEPSSSVSESESSREARDGSLHGRLLDQRSEGEADLDISSAVAAIEGDDWDLQLRGIRSLNAIAKQGERERKEILEAGVVSIAKLAACPVDRPMSERISVSALTTLFNISLVKANRAEMVDVIPHVCSALASSNRATRQAAVAVAVSLSVHEDHRMPMIYHGYIPHLVRALQNSSTQRDACKALFHLSYLLEGALQLITEGAIDPLINLLTPPDENMAEKATCVLANVTRSTEGCQAIAEHPSGIPSLVEILSDGSELAKEQAAATLLLIAEAKEKYRETICSEAPQISLDSIVHAGTARGKSKVSREVARYTKPLVVLWSLRDHITTAVLPTDHPCFVTQQQDDQLDLNY